MKRKGTRDLSLTQRRQLETLLKAGIHKKKIAEQLGICLATVYRELKRGECEQRHKLYDVYGDFKGYKTERIYSADKAEFQYRLNQSAHGAPLKIGNDFAFVKEIERRVVEGKLSPCAALGEIKRSGKFKTSISKTTLYRYIRSGYIFSHIAMKDVKLNKRHYEHSTVKQPPKGTSIEKRPSEIDERNSFGHWEMDCVLGRKYTKDTLLTFTERLTRYELIFKMPDHKAATIVRFVNKLERRFGSSFRKIFKSITVDNGSEFSDFASLEKSIYGGKRTNVYYCHPYSSYERGSNERMNREIRRLIPKGTDLTVLSDKRIQAVEDWVNAYPREIFGYASSGEMFRKELGRLAI